MLQLVDFHMTNDGVLLLFGGILFALYGWVWSTIHTVYTNYFNIAHNNFSLLHTYVAFKTQTLTNNTYRLQHTFVEITFSSLYKYTIVFIFITHKLPYLTYIIQWSYLSLTKIQYYSLSRYLIGQTCFFYYQTLIKSLCADIFISFYKIPYHWNFIMPSKLLRTDKLLLKWCHIPKKVN